ncbi:hypothetical protein GCM10027612_80160 [Microbispora bryophytorum subsp. camponoti]
MIPARDHRGATGGEHYLAARVLNALLREDYAGISARVTHDKDGVAIVLASGRRVGLAAGHPFQDFATAPHERPRLAEVLETLEAVAHPADAEGVAAFERECHETLAALEAHHRMRGEVARRLRGRHGLIRYESLAAAVDHPLYPTARCRLGVSPADLAAYAPEFAPEFRMRWAAAPRERVTLSRPDLPGWWPAPGDVGLPPGLARTHVLFPVHPLTEPLVAGLPGLVAGPQPYATVRPTLSTRTVEVRERVHLKVPLPVSTLGLRNRRSIKPGTLRDGALAESLLREILAREPGLRVRLADEQTFGHAEHEYLGWLVRDLPEGEIVPVAALLAPLAPPPEGAPADGSSCTRWPSATTAATRRRCCATTSRRCSRGTSRCSSGTASRWRPTSRTSRWCSATGPCGCWSRTTTGCWPRPGGCTRRGSRRPASATSAC